MQTILTMLLLLPWLSFERSKSTLHARVEAAVRLRQQTKKNTKT
jgi:hypothetical protein